MGQVFLAERADDAFRKRVAVKVLRRGLEQEGMAGRLRAERQLLARLEHPHIARLLDGGETADGRPYLILELVEGEPIVGQRQATTLGRRVAVSHQAGGVRRVPAQAAHAFGLLRELDGAPRTARRRSRAGHCQIPVKVVNSAPWGLHSRSETGMMASLRPAGHPCPALSDHSFPRSLGEPPMRRWLLPFLGLLTVGLAASGCQNGEAAAGSGSPTNGSPTERRGSRPGGGAPGGGMSGFSGGGFGEQQAAVPVEVLPVARRAISSMGRQPSK